MMLISRTRPNNAGLLPTCRPAQFCLWLEIPTDSMYVILIHPSGEAQGFYVKAHITFRGCKSGNFRSAKQAQKNQIQFKLITN